MNANEIVAALRKAADEIASEGHAGWGNVCAIAADHIEHSTYVPETPPEGWTQFTHPEDQRVGLCHADRPWWTSPNGHWYCGTCHLTPWRGNGFVHKAEQELYYQQSECERTNTPEGPKRG